MAATTNISFDDLRNLIRGLTTSEKEELADLLSEGRRENERRRSSYESAYRETVRLERELRELEEDRAKLAEEMLDADDERLESLRKEEESLQRQKRITEEQLARARDKERYADSAVGKAQTLSNKLEEIVGHVKAIDGHVMHMLEPWAAADDAAAKYARTVGLAKKGMEDLRNASIRGVVRGKIGFDFAMDPAQLVEAQQSYVEAIGRNVTLDINNQRSLAAISKMFSNGNELISDFDKFGLSISNAGNHLGKMFNEASKGGISMSAYAKNVQQGLAIAQTYTFRDGLRGMEAMARRASEIRMDMQQVSSFASSFDTVEKALKSSAQLQVLGGGFSAGADALGLLNDSLNDLESAEKRMERFTEGLATFNKSTGEAEVSTFNRLRLKRYAEITGQDYSKVMEVTRRQAMRGEIEAQMNMSKNISSFDDDLKSLIKNTAIFENGKAGVSINGKFKTLDEITEKDRDELIARSRTDSENIQDIAKNLRSLLDYRKGISAQYRGVKASVTRPIGWATKGATGAFANSGFFGNLVLHIGALASVVTTALAIAGEGAAVFSGIKNFFRFGRRRGGSAASNQTVRGTVEKIFSSRAKNKITSKAGQTAAGKIAESAAEKAATKTIGGTVAKEATEKAAAGITEKAVGRTVLKASTKKLLTGMAKGGAVSLIGTAGDIATDVLVDQGKIKKGGAGHGAMKIGSQMLQWGGLGAMIAGPIGAAVGAAVGGVIGARQFNKARNELVVDNQLSALGIERKGNYSVERLEKIDRAMQTGKVSNSLRKKMLREGDTEMLAYINQIGEGKKEAKEAKRKERQDRRDKLREQRIEAKSKFGTAQFEIEKAFFGGKGIENGVKIRGKKEEGRSTEFTRFEEQRRRREVNRERRREERISNAPVKVDIDGSIKLDMPLGQSIDLMKEIKRNPRLLAMLTEEVMKRMNVTSHGGYVAGKTQGDYV